MFGLYVHVPFCVSKCRYCDFASRPPRPGEIERYLDALESEIAGAGERARGADTVYLGGGTPTLLEPDRIGRILASLREAFAVEADAEITVEANPGTVTPGRARALLDLGVNRVSLGVQSFDDAQLRRLGRAHAGADAAEAYAVLRRAGFRNVGLDLIHSLPEQTPADWRRDLERAADLGPEHLSLYALTVEEGTPFGEERTRGTLRLPAEEDEVAMLEISRDVATRAGYEHYEISNFARPGFRCRHNANCWSLGEYRGFGAAAHSFLRRPAARRFANHAEPEIYAAAVLSGGDPAAHREEVAPRRLAGEALMLALRTRDGVEVDAFRAAHGATPAEMFRDAVERGTALGWLERSGGRLRLTRTGVLFSNRLFGELF